MKLRIIKGKRPSDVTDRCLEDIVHKNVQWPRKRAFLIVPDQTTADMERRFLELRRRAGGENEKSDTNALMMMDVVSFRRFSGRILSEVGGQAGNYLDAVTKTLLLYRILHEKKDEFSVFSSLSGRISFLAEMESILSDFFRYQISPEMLSSLDQTLVTPELFGKLSDFSVLMEHFTEAVTALDCELSETEPDYAAKILSSCTDDTLSAKWPLNRLSYLKNTTVWILGFSQTRGFTPQEWNIISALKETCEEVNIGIVTDMVPEKKEEIFLGSDVFRFGRQELWRIKEAFPDVEIVEAREKDLLPPWAAMNHVAEAFSKRTRVPFSGDAGNISLLHYENPVEELRFVAGEVQRLVLEEGFRYRDIRVVLCDYSAYESHLHSVFREYGLDPFLDKKRPLSETVLIRFLLSFLNMGVSGWSFSSVMTCIRTGICHITAQDADRLENYCLKYGLFKGYRILQRERFLAFEDEEGLRLWDIVERALLPLKKHLDILIKAKTGQEKARELLLFLEEYGTFTYEGKKGIAAQVQILSDQWAEDLNQESALALTSAFQEIVLLLKRIEGPVGDMELSLRAFRDMLESGMDSVFSGAIPTYTDQIEIADIRRRGWQKNSKVLFLVGAKRDVFPYKKQPDGYFRSHEREIVSKLLNTAVPDRKKEHIYADSFAAYALLQSVEERFYMSYAGKDEHSSVMQLFLDVFSSLSKKEGDYEGFHDARLFSKEPLLRYIRSIRMGEDAKRKMMANAFLEAFSGKHLIMEKPLKRDALVSLALLDKRYPNTPTMSISQIETYASCPFRHFSDYALHLTEREEYKLVVSDIGVFLHKILEDGLSEYKMEFDRADSEEEENAVQKKYEERDFSEWSEALFLKANAEIKNPAALEDQFLGSTKGNIIRTAKWSLEGIFKGFQAQSFSPEHLEWTFSQMLSVNGREICFRGVIDRVDISRADDGFRVVDYKSGNRQVDYEGLYHGLSLQLPLYVEAFRNENPKSIPKEAGYFHLTAPMLRWKQLSGKPSLEELEKNRSKEFSLRQMDLSEEDLMLSGRYAKKKIEEYSEKLFSGQFPVAPVKQEGKDVACKYCEYKGVCGIDPENPPVSYASSFPSQKKEDGKKRKAAEIFSEILQKEARNI